MKLFYYFIYKKTFDIPFTKEKEGQQKFLIAIDK